MNQNGLIESQLDELHCMEQCDSDVLLLDLVNKQEKIKENYELYYDKKTDQIWIDQYYCNISKDASPSQLFHEFRELLTNTHKYRHPYYVSKDQYLYTWVDLQPNGQLKSIYSGEHFSPQKVIEEDFKTIQKRFKRYQQLIMKDRFPKIEIERQVRMISRDHRFNAEHVVPQSWYKAREPMKGDLHHLFACEPKCNNVRSNFPYFEFKINTSNKSIRDHCGTYDFRRFEPESGKGTVARAMLYFLLRYPNRIRKKYRRRIDIPLLYHWHEQFPATEYEKHRNKAIFEIQGNRNPFIDLPKLTNEIEFLHLK
ncbi:endonuclease I family protein [Halalkalibacter oceani]|uniref:endonuclease I family protein n=1 Tax=Halalkalibacter oceani TaxID=1653776 RepID=UPI00339B2C7A